MHLQEQCFWKRKKEYFFAIMKKVLDKREKYDIILVKIFLEINNIIV